MDVKRGVIGLFVILVFAGLVSAAPTAPTNIHAVGNVTPVYDEGTFTINWTAGTQVTNYSIYISIDGGSTYFLKGTNDSNTGYSFSNFTQANYTFKIGSVNGTGTEVNSTSLVSIFVDRTPPVITLPVYVNATAKINTQLLTLNISASDANSGLTGSSCIVDINGVNQTLTMSNGWCNSSSVSLSGASGGNKTIYVWVNDTVGIFGLNDSYVVLIHSAPQASAVCSPSIVYVGDAFPCTCSGSSSELSIVSATGSSNAPGGTGIPGNVGQFTYTCTVTDSAGSSASSSTTYTVNSAGSGGSPVLTPSSDELSKGYNKILYAGWSLSFDLGGASHAFNVENVSTNSSTITISSTPQTATLYVGQEKKFDLTGDGYYDLDVKLNSVGVIGLSANFTVQTIHEAVSTSQTSQNQTTSSSGATTSGEEKQPNLVWLWIFIGVVIVLLVLWAIWYKMSRGKHKKKHRK